MAMGGGAGVSGAGLFRSLMLVSCLSPCSPTDPLTRFPQKLYFFCQLVFLFFFVVGCMDGIHGRCVGGLMGVGRFNRINPPGFILLKRPTPINPQDKSSGVSSRRHYHATCDHRHKGGPKGGMIFHHHQLEKIQKHQRAHIRTLHKKTPGARASQAVHVTTNDIESGTTIYISVYVSIHAHTFHTRHTIQSRRCWGENDFAVYRYIYIYSYIPGTWYILDHA